MMFRLFQVFRHRQIISTYLDEIMQGSEPWILIPSTRLIAIILRDRLKEEQDIALSLDAACGYVNLYLEAYKRKEEQ